VETYVSGDINTNADRERLARWRADLVISTNFNHYVGAKVREQRPAGVWNLHKSYLPHYPGMAPSFYALLQGAESVGATLHVMAKGFDTGDIIKQLEVPVEEGDTVYTLNQRVSERGGEMLAEFLEGVDPTQVVVTKQPEGDWPNNSYPTRAAVREFRAKGLKF
jgi:methionyl-tRNA formyltransferase